MIDGVSQEEPICRWHVGLFCVLRLRRVDRDGAEPEGLGSVEMLLCALVARGTLQLKSLLKRQGDSESDLVGMVLTMLLTISCHIYEVSFRSLKQCRGVPCFTIAILFQFLHFSMHLEDNPS